MTFTRATAIAVIIASCGLGAVQAATLRNAQPPAEFPPSDYAGRQYVDSRGCVFVRTGVDGLVNWVPRVNRGRDQICGAKPTFANAAPQNLPVIKDPVVAAAPAARVVETVQAPAAPVAKKPKFTLATLFAPRPKPTQPATVSAPVAVAVQKPTVVAPNVRRVAPAPVSVAAPRVVASPRVVTAQSSCAGMSALTSQYMSGSGVRCGPQAQSPVGNIGAVRAAPQVRAVQQARTVPQTRTVRRTQADPIVPPVNFDYNTSAPQTQRVVQQQTVTAAGQRVAPRHVVENQRLVRQYVPDGYRDVWDDDRLNPKRAQQTFEGKAEMELVWTKTVPRILLNRNTGQNVTSLFPFLRFPFLNMASQRKAEASGHSMGFAAEPATPQRRVVKAAVATPAAQKNYIQVGTYGVGSNAQKSAQRLARAGLPVRIWSSSRGGKNYQIVVSGPYASAAQANGALGTIRKSGFGDAFLR